MNLLWIDDDIDKLVNNLADQDIHVAGVQSIAVIMAAARRCKVSYPNDTTDSKGAYVAAWAASSPENFQLALRYSRAAFTENARRIGRALPADSLAMLKLAWAEEMFATGALKYQRAMHKVVGRYEPCVPFIYRNYHDPVDAYRRYYASREQKAAAFIRVARLISRAVFVAGLAIPSLAFTNMHRFDGSTRAMGGTGPFTWSNGATRPEWLPVKPPSVMPDPSALGEMAAVFRELPEPELDQLLDTRPRDWLEQFDWLVEAVSLSKVAEPEYVVPQTEKFQALKPGG